MAIVKAYRLVGYVRDVDYNDPFDKNWTDALGRHPYKYKRAFSSPSYVGLYRPDKYTGSTTDMVEMNRKWSDRDYWIYASRGHYSKELEIVQEEVMVEPHSIETREKLE